MVWFGRTAVLVATTLRFLQDDRSVARSLGTADLLLAAAALCALVAGERALRRRREFTSQRFA